MKLPFLNNDKQTGEIYCGILLKEAHGVCYVYEKKPTSVTLLKQKEFQYSDGWDHIVDDIDEALSLIEQEMGKQTIITQCVFFVFAHLIDQSTHEIAKPYISKLRDISKLLELKPVGYMEVIDAVHEELEHEKQTRLSSIVVELDDTQMTIFLFKGGHKIAVQHTSRSDNFAEDMQFSLEKMAQSHILPNHIYLYDSTDLAEESSDLLLYSWKKNLFIQQPRIAVVPSSRVSGALLALLEKQLCEKPLSTPQKQEVQPSEVMGFTIGGEEQQEEVVIESPQKKSFNFKLPSFSFPTFSRLKIIPFLLVPIIIIGICGVLLYYFHTATISITVPQEKKDAEITIQATKKPTKNTQVELLTLTTSFSASEKKDTTGKKDIGEKAGGEVTLYSYEEKERQLSKGTKLQINSLSFETDDAVSIPAAQFATDGITKNPGKSKAKVRAIILGPESNVEKNKRFTVADISSNSVFGINEGAIGGGTKKTVRTVSKNDIDGLKTSVLDKAKIDALNKQKTETAFLILPELSTANAIKEEFSAEVGEEATSLNYKATGEVLVSRIPKSAITSFIEKKLESGKPNGYKTETVTFTVKKQKKLESGEMELTIGGEILFSKVIDAKKILQAVRAQGKEEAVLQIQSQFGISTVSIAIQPSLPMVENRMPFWENHLRVELLR